MGIDNPPLNVLLSMNALRRAWLQVRRSGDSAGTDGVKPSVFEKNLDNNLNQIYQQVQNGTYQPYPVRRFYIKKASGKQRPISVWSVRDRVLQRVIHDYLTGLFEQIFLSCSFGFRPGLGIEQATEVIIQGRDSGLIWVLDADILDCFASIPTKDLLGQVARVTHSPAIIRLIEQWLYTPVHGRPHEIAGVSQGGVISPLLANLYLHRFDEMIVAALPQSSLVRFADDFIILNHSEQETIWSLEVARRSLSNLRLNLNMRKTRLVTFDEGFQFLGIHFKGKRYETSRTVSPKEGE